MATKNSTDGLLADASKIVDVWTANSSFGLGTVTLTGFKAAMTDAATAVNTVESKRTELTALMNARDDKTRALRVLVTRARSGIRATYGPDSSQYEEAGGTRASERKKPKRKPKSNPPA